MPTSAISCRQLTKHYGHIRALDGLDIEVPQGSLFGFLGPNGAGKTTIMRVLLGLTAPTGGHAEVLGFDVEASSLEVRRRVGYLPQQPRFHDELTAREVLRYARGFYPRDADSHIDHDIDEVLDLVGLTAKADARSGQLSGGQRQRLGIAQAQIHRPELLILDEPAAALDPMGRRDVLEVMRRLKNSTTVFYSTHILDDVQQVSDEVAILKDGRCVLQSPMQDLLVQEETFIVTIIGAIDDVLATLRAQPWVTGVTAAPAQDETALAVSVSDKHAAQEHLLRQVLRHDVQVIEFGRRRSRLEDVFVDIVRGSR